MDVRVGLWRRLSAEKSMLLNCGVGEDSWESLGLQGDPASPSWRRSALGVHWKDWCWGWNSSTLAISYEELTHWKRPWCWEGLGAGGEGDDRGWDGWMASPTWWTRVWVNSGSWWWTGRPGVLWFMESQRGRHYWATELNQLTSPEVMLKWWESWNCVRKDIGSSPRDRSHYSLGVSPCFPTCVSSPSPWGGHTPALPDGVWSGGRCHDLRHEWPLGLS